MVTGDITEDTRKKILDMNAQLIYKPFSIEELKQKLENIS